ncbi:hypothetical protein K435DRAFT_364877 [Dendrothele bispora CBS 962.96]|uniref:Uncharacterized protein n=1 Tax=Dendrothele bispora (strain CBS 962.96) TaxID=1314807 RepID=A0A4S8LCR4_DENBC|nr:hypothetical protein K435DRAFT_364877 [Dendrothele bispora CBS 962.96]
MNQNEATGQDQLDASGDQHGSQSPSQIAPLTLLPEITPDSGLGLDSIMAAGGPDAEKIQKRASNVQKLAQENEKLKAELAAMSERLEAAERKREQLKYKKQEVKEPPAE